MTARIRPIVLADFIAWESLHVIAPVSGEKSSYQGHCVTRPPDSLFGHHQPGMVVSRVTICVRCLVGVHCSISPDQMTLSADCGDLPVMSVTIENTATDSH